jgi:AcrR family transcriptional regulator
VQAQQAILDATLNLLATEGFTAMSIEGIAANAGVGKKTIYRWWASKEELVIDAIKSFQQAKNPVVDTGSLRDDLVVMFRNALQSWSGPLARDLVVRLLGEVTAHTAIYQVFYDRIVAPRFEQFAHVIQRAQERGEVRLDLDADQIMGFLAGPVWYYLFFNPNSAPLAPDLPERIVDVALQGIARQNSVAEGDMNVALRNVSLQ